MDNFTIIQVNPAEIDKYKDIIVGLWKANLSNGSDKRFDWLYKKNPAGPAVTWLAKDEKTGEFVGCCSLWSREVKTNGRTFRMGIAIDFAVNKSYRVFGPALKIERAIIANSKAAGFDFLFAWPSPSSTAVFTRAGYQVLGDVSSWVKILRSKEKITKFIKFRIIARFLAPVIDCYLTSQDLQLRLFKPRMLSGTIMQHCDKRFDIFSISSSNSCSIDLVKNSDFLNWRYTDCPYEKFTFFALIDDRDNSIKGYLAYTIKDKTAVVSDLEVIADGYIDYLLVEFVNVLKKCRIPYITLGFLGNNNFKKHLRRLNFWGRPTNRDCVVYGNKAILTSEDWSVLDGDMDL